jgi:hypothetical protein
MPQRAIRFSDEVHHQINKEARTRGFSSPTAFIRSTIEQELSGRRDGSTGVEERLSADLEQLVSAGIKHPQFCRLCRSAPPSTWAGTR